jgi:hypothetical protein
MPNLDLDDEAMANLRTVLTEQHHPTAAQNNLARQRRALREARARESEVVAH